ncbi:hypothetical protein C8Q79DRAFT_1013195 [Trametes meyenii]|nr:hypothetical protein C8Q79DRAFT_1013195 [Trametes meyenii]
MNTYGQRALRVITPVYYLIRDFECEQLGIVDSIPELDSVTWAKTLMCKAVDALRQHLNALKIDLSLFESVVTLPSEDDLQIDNWSCGLFVMIAMQSFIDEWATPLLGESAKEDVQAGALRALLNVPLNPPLRLHQAEPEPEAPTSMSNTTEEDAPSSKAERGAKWMRAPLPLSDTDSESEPSEAERKYPRSSLTVKAPPRSWAKKKSVLQRRVMLEKDKWVAAVTAHSVKCKGCLETLNRNKNHEYNAFNWRQHKKKCSRIMGVAYQRIAVVEGVVKSAGHGGGTLMAFFARVCSRNDESTADKNRRENDERGLGRRKPRVSYRQKETSMTPMITKFFKPGTGVMTCNTEELKRTQNEELTEADNSQTVACVHLRGQPYAEYKNFPKTKAGGPEPVDVHESHMPLKSEIPLDGNAEILEAKWMLEEQRRLDETLSGWSTMCHGTMTNHSGICEACQDLANEDYSFKKAIYRKNKEAQLDSKTQHEIQLACGKYTPGTFMSTEAHELEAQLCDPAIFVVWKQLACDDNIVAFISLWDLACEGKLENQDKFIQLCKVMKNQVKRLTRQQSAQQYEILCNILGGPHACTLCYVVKRSLNCLSNLDIDYENLAHAKHLMDSIQYSGPVAIASDCTKVQQCLMYSNDYGSHILGSTLSLDEVAVVSTDNIEDRILTDLNISQQIPLPQIPPLVIALLPTKGNDTAIDIHSQYKLILQMAAQLGILIVSMAADGASSELGAQSLMDKEQSDHPPLAYNYPLYGIKLRAPVFDKTGPLVSIQDPQHTWKTCRNQLQHSTHTASMGSSYVVNRSLMLLYEMWIAGLQLWDVKDVDKQDDGTARRMFHAMALRAMMGGPQC